MGPPHKIYKRENSAVSMGDSTSNVRSQEVVGFVLKKVQVNKFNLDSDDHRLKLQFNIPLYI